MSNGIRYYYKVFTRDDVANYSSGIADDATPVDNAPPSSVTDFTAAASDAQVILTWSNSGDADFAGDGRSDVAIYLPVNGTWYIINSSDGTRTIRQFGGPAATPVPGDYDGDGKTDIAVFFRRGGRWNILKSSDGQQLTGGAIQFGFQATVPVPADYNGDGLTDLCVYLKRDNKWFVKSDPLGGLVTGAPIAFGTAAEPAQVQYQILQKFYGW